LLFISLVLTTRVALLGGLSMPSTSLVDPKETSLPDSKRQPTEAATFENKVSDPGTCWQSMAVERSVEAVQAVETCLETPARFGCGRRSTGRQEHTAGRRRESARAVRFGGVLFSACRMPHAACHTPRNVFDPS
jgi:hypothetical protein